MVKKSTKRTAARNVSEKYRRTEMQKDSILKKLRDKGCRITKQRQILLDIILKEECTCCKEIYYKASRIDKKIGSATVYRMMNTLEEIGAISRNSFYSVTKETENGCKVELSDHTICRLSQECWMNVVKIGLKQCGYIENQEIAKLIVNKEES